MTCIVGVAENGIVTIGGDSAGVSGWNVTIRADEKVFANGEFVMGFTSSYRMGQLLRHRLRPPEAMPSQSVEHFMCVTFIDAVRQCLADGGWKKVDNSVDKGGEFLVGYRGRLFQVAEDFQVGESVDGFAACGCGESFALGALEASREFAPKLTARDRVLAALNVAAKRSAGVRAPFSVADSHSLEQS